MDTRQDKEKCLEDMLALVPEPDTRVKDQFGDQIGGSEWETIKILFEGD
jgi:hypothetical protein